VLSYLLIFGYLGLPALGVVGAGRSYVCGESILSAASCLLVPITYYRRLPVAGSLRELAGFRAVSGFTSRFIGR